MSGRARDFVPDNPYTGMPGHRRPRSGSARLALPLRRHPLYDLSRARSLHPCSNATATSSRDSVYNHARTFHDGARLPLRHHPSGRSVWTAGANEGRRQTRSGTASGRWPPRAMPGWTAEIAIPFKTLRFSTRTPGVASRLPFIGRAQGESALASHPQEWGPPLPFYKSRSTRYPRPPGPVSGAVNSFLTTPSTPTAIRGLVPLAPRGRPGGILKTALPRSWLRTCRWNNDSSPKPRPTRSRSTSPRFKSLPGKTAVLPGMNRTSSTSATGSRSRPAGALVLFFRRQIGPHSERW